MELFKWMDSNNWTWILNLINHWWVHKCAPEDVFAARMVSIFKKGNTDLPENYRPISLLNSFDKIYMIMIRNRMRAVLEERLCDTQYGSDHPAANLKPFTSPIGYKYIGTKGANMIITFFRLGPFLLRMKWNINRKLQPAE